MTIKGQSRTGQTIYASISWIEKKCKKVGKNALILMRVYRNGGGFCIRMKMHIRRICIS